MAVTFNNSTFDDAQSTTGVFALNTFTGTELTSAVTTVTVNGTITTPGSTATVTLSVNDIPTVNTTGTYLGYSDAGGGTGDYVYYFSVTTLGISTPLTIGVTGAATLPVLSVATDVITTAETAPVGPSIPCYAAGTLIRTTRGDVAVEDLAVGDHVVTASGGQRPIVWLGHRTVACAPQLAADTVSPIRIRAGAVAPGMPSRDLRVSPDHALFFDDVLIQARFLVNGTTITRDAVESVTYWHIELDAHDVMIAENMPAESYLDVGNRHTFGGADVVALRPDFAAAGGEGHCAPLVTSGERLRAVRGWIAERARHLGARTTADTALRLVADGIALTPLSIEQGRFRYAVPAGVESLRLMSRAGVPAELTLDSPDSRRLGLCVTALELDGEPVSLDDPRLDAGWHDSEAGWRWTDGAAALPVAGTIAFSAHGLEAYPAPAPRLAAPAAQGARRLAMAG